MNTYTAIVTTHADKLNDSGLFKTASDLASLLDNPLFAYPKGKQVDRYSLQCVAKIREQIYHNLCALFTESSLPLPPLEQEFYTSLLALKNEEKDVAEARRIKEHVNNEVNGSRSPDLLICQAIAVMLEAFPECTGQWGSVSKKNLVAKLNSILVPLGCKPVRPDYGSYKKNKGRTMKAPNSTRIMVVDDSVEEIAKTLRALAGWEKVTLIPFHYRRTVSEKKLNLDSQMRQTALEILEQKPHVVLMDEGLIDFDGSELIPVIQALTEKPPLFVANTGGSDDKQRRVGAFPNCNKGEKLAPVAQAIEALE